MRIHLTRYMSSTVSHRIMSIDENNSFFPALERNLSRLVYKKQRASRIRINMLTVTLKIPRAQ